MDGESAGLAARARFLGSRGALRGALAAFDRQQHLALAFRALATLLGLRRRRAALGLDAAAQCVHETDHVARRRRLLLLLRQREAGLLLAHQLDQRVLVVVLERRRLEVALLGVEDMLREL